MEIREHVTIIIRSAVQQLRGELSFTRRAGPWLVYNVELHLVWHFLILLSTFFLASANSDGKSCNFSCISCRPAAHAAFQYSSVIELFVTLFCSIAVLFSATIPFPLHSGWSQFYAEVWNMTGKPLFHLLFTAILGFSEHNTISIICSIDRSLHWSELN